jgi:hypothetical protein
VLQWHRLVAVDDVDRRRQRLEDPDRHRAFVQMRAEHAVWMAVPTAHELFELGM